MVSTRSQSRLSNSSLQTGQDHGDVHSGEVSSAPQRRARNRTRATVHMSEHLEPIAEERPARRGRQQKKQPDAVEQLDQAAGISDSLVDKLAGDIFAALEASFGADARQDAESGSEDESSSGVEDDDDEEQHISERKLQWRPDLKLPGQGLRWGNNRANDGAGSSGSGSIAADLLAEKSGGMSKLLNAPSLDERAAARAARKAAPDTAGKAWFDLPATAITDEVKADLRVLRLRSAFDPKKFYKKFDDTKFPKYFQFGTVVEGAQDFYSGRLTRRERKRTLAEEVMADGHLTEVRKKRYNKMQEEASYWSKKTKGRKTDNPRLKKKPKKPKH